MESELTDILLAVIDHTWQDRETAIRATTRRPDHRCTGRITTTTLKSALNGAIRRGLLEYEGNMIKRARGGLA